MFVTGPTFTRFDINARKRFEIHGKKNIEVAVDVVNVFDAINFNAVAQAGSGATINQITLAYQVRT